MLSQSKLISAWCIFASIYTILSLEEKIAEKYFGDSSIPWLIGGLVGCFMTWKIGKLFKKAECREKLLK